MIDRLVALLLPRRLKGTARFPRASVEPEGAPTLPASNARWLALLKAFTPSRPQRNARYFVGRRAELARIIRVIEERGHVVLYGERGRGKTSLANLVAEVGRSRGYMVSRFTCSAETNFDAIMRGLARNLPASLLVVPANTVEDAEGCECALPPGRLQPQDVALLPGRLAAPHLVLMVDEFDRVIDDATRTRMADTIKQVSDRGVALSFVIIGVSEDMQQLLGRHPSIQRNVVGVPLPLMSDTEILSILDLGAHETGLTFSPLIHAPIVALARGVPYIAQLLALRAAQRVLQRGAMEVLEPDLSAAIRAVIAEIDPHVSALYAGLTLGGQDRAMEALLRAVASGPHDKFGRIPAECFAGPCASGVAGESAALTPLQRLVEVGALRTCTSSGANVYSFGEAMLPHYILLHAAQDKYCE